MTVAAASEEMVSTTADIAHNCENASVSANQSSNTTENGINRVEITINKLDEQAKKSREDAKLVEQLSPVGIYLFGSFAEGRNTEGSDFDFYIIVDDSVKDIPAETTKAYRSIRRTKQRPVDILVGTRSRFEARKNIPSVENEVFQKGVLLYGY